jgi:hypothetical protein
MNHTAERFVWEPGIEFGKLSGCAVLDDKAMAGDVLGQPLNIGMPG